MGLIVMIGNPFGMGGEQSGPGVILGKIPVGEPSLEVELTLNQILPALPFLDLLLLDSQALIDLQGLLRLENAPTIAHEHRWSPMLAYRREQHDEIIGQILRSGNARGKDSAAKIVQNRDNMKPGQMVLDCGG